MNHIRCPVDVAGVACRLLVGHTGPHLPMAVLDYDHVVPPWRGEPVVDVIEDAEPFAYTLGELKRLRDELDRVTYQRDILVAACKAALSDPCRHGGLGMGTEAALTVAIAEAEKQ